MIFVNRLLVNKNNIAKSLTGNSRGKRSLSLSTRVSVRGAVRTDLPGGIVNIGVCV